MFRLSVLASIFLFGCQNDVQVHPEDQYDEVFCVPDQNDPGFLFCCPEGYTDTNKCWEQANS